MPVTHEGQQKCWRVCFYIKEREEYFPGLEQTDIKVN